MPRTLTSGQRTLLRTEAVKARTLVTFHMDDGIYRYCDDADDCTDGVNVWTGASALASCADIKSGSGFAAEQVVLTFDGTRMQQSGFTDPAALFRLFLTLKLHNRRVDIAYGLSHIVNPENYIQMILPAYAGKINNAKVISPQLNFASLPEANQTPLQQTLEITLDSLAIRYSWITGRTRSDADHQELYPGDRFFKFVNDARQAESTLYWGKANPTINHV